MHNDATIFTKFKNKDYQRIENMYADKTFANYYQEVTTGQESKKDLGIYKRLLEKNDVILEIGSGNGRVFNPLYELGYDIYGIEPAEEMMKYINPEAHNRIFKLTIQEIQDLSILNVTKVIIPATTISLFTPNEFENFIEYLRKFQPKINEIIFDFMPLTFFEEKDGQINVENVNNKKFYTVNFLNKEKSEVVFNIVNQNKLGISKKYIHSIAEIKEIFDKYHIKLILLENSSKYKLVVGTF